MIKRLITLLSRNLPFIAKRVTLLTLLYAQQRNFSYSTLSCSSLQGERRWYIEKIQSMSIKIKLHGQLVGLAYCFADNYLVSASEQLLENRPNTILEFYLGDERLKGSFRIIGHYQNLTFIECTLTDKIAPMYGSQSTLLSYSDVDLVQKKDFMSIKRGCFITEDSGYAIVDGEGKIGSLIAAQDGVVGITVQIGKGQDQGFIRAIKWKSLIPILNYVKGRTIHLGISTQSLQNQEGLTVVRVAPNSPLKNEIMMGDIILCANGQRFNNAESLLRICVQSGGQADLKILREGKTIDVRIVY